MTKSTIGRTFDSNVGITSLAFETGPETLHLLGSAMGSLTAPASLWVMLTTAMANTYLDAYARHTLVTAIANLIVVFATPSEGEIHPARAGFAVSSDGRSVTFGTPAGVNVNVLTYIGHIVNVDIDFQRASVTLASLVADLFEISLPSSVGQSWDTYSHKGVFPPPKPRGLDAEYGA